MAGMTSRRGRVAVLAATAVLAALTLTACGKSGGTTPTPTTDPANGNGRIGEIPSGSASPTSGTGNGGGNGGGATQAAPTFPSDAKAYGLEILKAWAGKNNTRLATLVDSNSVTQIAGFGFPNSQWTNYLCNPDPTYTNCTYTNASGDVVRLILTNALLGKPKAGSAITYDKANIPKDPAGYAMAFVYAWSNDNYPGMAVLSNSSVVSHFQGAAKFQGHTTQPTRPCTNNTSKTCIEVSALPLGSRDSIYLIIDTGKISQGKLNGIIGYQDN